MIISGSTSPKAVAFSLVVHRMTRSKKRVKLLNRTGTGISWTDVLKQINHLSFDTQNSSKLVTKNIPKGQTTHVTIDHSDIRWQTLTGFATTDHTNATIYVPRIQPLPDTTNFLENETINTPLVKRNIVDYQE